MILSSKESQCTLMVLELLDKGDSKYKMFFKKTKVSHTTLQKVLKWLIEKGFVERRDKGHMDVDYGITDKGENILSILINLKRQIK